MSRVQSAGARSGAPVTVGVGVLVFLAALALDYAAACYAMRMIERRYCAAGAWSATMGLFSAASVYVMVDMSWWALLPQCVGLFVGTVLAGYRRERERVPRAIACYDRADDADPAQDRSDRPPAPRETRGARGVLAGDPLSPVAEGLSGSV